MWWTFFTASYDLQFFFPVCFIFKVLFCHFVGWIGFTWIFLLLSSFSVISLAAAALGDILKNSCVTSLMSCHCLRKIDLEISPADSEYLLEKQQSLTSSQVPALRIFERDAVDIGIV